MILEHFPVAPLGCNCVILGDEECGTAIVVDPGGEAPRILARLQELGLTCEGIVHTHTHFDHIGATKDVQEATNAPTMIFCPPKSCASRESAWKASTPPSDKECHDEAVAGCHFGDPNDLTHRLDLWTARFDVLSLWTLPTAGVLMLIDHSWWPYPAMIGGSAYIDGLGRYMSAVLGLREKGIWTGTPRDWFATKVIFVPVIVLSAVAIAMGLAEAT